MHCTFADLGSNKVSSSSSSSITTWSTNTVGRGIIFLTIIYTIYVLCVQENVNESPSVALLIHGRHSQKDSQPFEAVKYQWAVQRSVYVHSIATEAAVRNVVMEEPVSNKTIRRTRKANLTKGIGALRRLIGERDSDGVSSQLAKLKVLFEKFEQAHDIYNETFADENDIQTSADYFSAAEGTYINEITNAHDWISSVVDLPVPTSHEPGLTSQLFDIMSLPKRTINVFSGDRLMYKECMAVFGEVVDRRPVDSHMNTYQATSIHIRRSERID